MRRAWVDGLFGLAVGAGLGLVAHVPTLVALASATPDDELSRRVAAELARVTDETIRFAASLTAGVAAVSGLVGACTALLIAFGAPGLRRRRLAVVVATALALMALVLRAFLDHPALLEPSLGGSEGALAPVLARVAAVASPRHVDVALGACVAALAGAGLVRRRRELAASLGRRRGTAAALLLAAAALGLTTAAAPAPAVPGSFLILAADSLRPDRFTPKTAPHVLALAARGVSYERALSPIASTTPAWISILTGLYPHNHGVRHMFPRRELRPAYLDYLPKTARAAGYETVVISDYAGDFFPTFDLGFDRAALPPPLTLPLVFQREALTRSAIALALLDNPPGRAAFPVFRFLMTNADPERLADEVIDAVRGAPQRRFVVAFFSTTHVPFAAPSPWYRRFASPAYGGRHRYAYDLQRLSDATQTGGTLPPADVAQIRGLYDGALAAVDAAIGRVVDEVGPDTTVVVLSDHGENLFEPGNTTFHGKWFRGGDETLRVPLVFAGPGVPAGVRVPEPVSLVDVAPTVADLLGLPPAPADGRSLRPAWTGKLAPRDVFAETGAWLDGAATADGMRYPTLDELLETDPRDGFQLVLKTRYEDVVVEAKHRMLRRGPDKLILVPTTDGVRYERYDVERDPGQAKDLFRERADSAELARALRRFVAADPERALDPRDHAVRGIDD